MIHSAINPRGSFQRRIASMIHLTCTSYLHSQPASFDSPEPGHNPMQIDTWPLSLAKRQCRHTLYLCLYYGVGKHVVSTSPIKPPQPLVSFITYRNLHAKPLATIVTLTVSNSSLSVSALIDSGSVGNLISETLCHSIHLQNNPCESSYKIFSIIGKPRSVNLSICQCLGPIRLLLGCLQVEEITLLVLEMSTAVIILEHLWLVKNSTIVSWSTGDVLKWGPQYFIYCSPSVPPSKSSELEVNSIPIESPIEQKSVEAPFCTPVGRLLPQVCLQITTSLTMGLHC